MSDGGEGDESAMKKRMKQEEEDEEERVRYNESTHV